MPTYLLLERDHGGPQPHRPAPPIDQRESRHAWIEVREVMSGARAED